MPENVMIEPIKAISAKIATDVYDLTKSVVTKIAKHSLIELEVGFASYIEASYLKYSKVKTIINRFQPVELSAIYEDCAFFIDDTGIFIDEEDIWKNSDEYQRVIISGMAGSGKSLFMKNSFLRFCQSNEGVLPILIELRYFNTLSSPGIKNYIISTLSQHISHFDEKIVEYLLRSGKIVIFLDGYDELYSSLKRSVAAEIGKLSYAYPSTRIIVSGRPDVRFSSWSEFQELSVAPLTKSKCLNLIHKAVHPNDSKEKFYQQVKDNLFKTHQRYLVNPLMTYVMLFTSDQFIDFPTDVGAFYSKAFETLVRGHDVMKSDQFVREVRCDIKIKDIENVFGYFCALSFRDQCYEYNQQQARKYLKKALDLCSINHDSDDILEDFERNYCLLFLDASKYNFIHRTFQEYYAANCVNASELIDYFDYNKSILELEMESGRYFSMLASVGSEKFISKFFSPVLSDFLKELYPLRIKSPKRFVEMVISEFGVDDSGAIRLIAFGSRRSFFDVAFELLPIVEPSKFQTIFGVEEDMGQLADIGYSDDHGMELKMVLVSRQSNELISKLNVYKAIRRLVEDAKALENKIGRRTAKLKRMVAK